MVPPGARREGWPGGTVEDFKDLEKARGELLESGVAPVFLSQDDLSGFYEGYANSTLWPLLHYMVERARFSADWWLAYQRVNRKFAEVIMEAADENDQVWIHDYHLFLLPAMLRRHKKGLRVGFFLHTPFCSSEIFRVLPERAEILRGLLGADVIGFHTYSYLRHFRSSLLRVLGWESEMECIWHDGREVHMGIEWKPAIREHLEQASLLTPGTHVEEKQSALVWHYRKADPELGPWRARGLLDELTSMAANLPVTVHHGKKIVEISSLQVSKGAAVDFLLHAWECETALVAGDDQTDETMIMLTPENIEFHSVRVGGGPTRAAYRTDIAGMRRFLEELHAGLHTHEVNP